MTKKACSFFVFFYLDYHHSENAKTENISTNRMEMMKGVSQSKLIILWEAHIFFIISRLHELNIETSFSHIEIQTEYPRSRILSLSIHFVSKCLHKQSMTSK